jgi:hypothetical protein
MIKNHQLGFLGVFDRANFIELSGTHKKFGGGCAPVPGYHRYGLATCRSHQFLELLSIKVLPAVIDSELNQNDVFTASMTVKELRV